MTSSLDSGTIEVRGFLHLSQVFTDRGWQTPVVLPVEGELAGCELLNKLEIPEEQVEAVFINGKAQTLAQASVKPGDRVALVPPGTPGPYRVWLGFVEL